MQVRRTGERGSLRRKKTTSLGTAAALAAALVFTSGVPAHAVYYDGGMPSSYFDFQANTVNSTYQTYFQQAAARWTQSAAQTAIGRVTSSGNNMTAGNYSQSWYGLYTPYGTRGTRSFNIQVNSRTLIADGGSNSTNWIASTSTHELGHALSLGDNPNTSQSSLMKHSRNRATVIGPTSYDTQEVNGIY